MANLENPVNSKENPSSSTKRVHVVGLSRKNKHEKLRDPFIVDRVNQYLNDNKNLAFVEINDMVEALRRRHREYRRRNWVQFKILVERAFKVISKRASKEEVEPASEDSSSDIEECNDSDEVSINNSNMQIQNLYQSPMQKKSSQNSHLNENAELIDLSSDDDQNKDEFIDGINNSHHEPDVNPDEIDTALGGSSIPAATPQNKRRSLASSARRSSKSPLAVQRTNIKFADFGGNAQVLEVVCKLILHLKHPQVFKCLGIDAPRGFLLHGPPGCGKTLLATAIAGELDLPLLKVSAPELVGGVSGESEERVRDLFTTAIESAPCVLFIDEVDAITPNRQAAQREMERRIVAQIITSLDDLAKKDSTGQVLVVGATKRPDSLDPALRRAGRFDREVCLGIPDEKARLEILKVVCRDVKLSQDLNLTTIARLTPGFVGADLVSLVREAALGAIARVFHEIQVEESKSNERKRKHSPDEEEEKKDEKRVKEHNLDDKEKEKTDDSISMPDIDNLDECVNGNTNTHDEDIPLENPVFDKTDSRIVDATSDATNPNLDSLLRWLRETSCLSESQLKRFIIEQDDLNAALRSVQPSAKREGFATVPDVTWDDVGSLIQVREHLKMAILGPIKYQSQFARLGLIAPAGVLLCGPPGCGKTLLAKAVANEAGINFISVKGPELLNMYVGESERAVRTVFQRARNSSPCVIFFDELDALCPRRSDHDSGGGARVVNQMLTEMDGVGERRGVFLMAATNRPDIVDPAVLRPGRLDRTIFIGMPNAVDRQHILIALTKNGTQPPLSSDVSISDLAAREELNNWTGADLAALMREAALEAVRQAISLSDDPPENILVTSSHIEAALKSVRPSIREKDLLKYEEMKKQYSSIS